MTIVIRGADEVERRFLEQEHREIARGVNCIADVAALVGTVSAVDLSHELRRLLDWLELSLEPHAAWEEEWLYPRLDERAGSPWPTRLMRFEHDQIRRSITELEAERELLRHEPAHEAILRLRARLYGLDALIHAHLEREERFLLPVLDEAEPGPPAPPAMR